MSFIEYSGGMICMNCFAMILIDCCPVAHDALQQSRGTGRARKLLLTNDSSSGAADYSTASYKKAATKCTRRHVEQIKASLQAKLHAKVREC
jgi:hypothetical protein